MGTNQENSVYKSRPGNYYPFTRFGMTAIEAEQLRRIIEMAQSEGVDYEIGSDMLAALEKVPVPQGMEPYHDDYINEPEGEVE